MPDNINEQMGEVVLMSLNNWGNIISSLPISGGYGDSITFSSIIHNPQMIEVKYKAYSNDVVSETMKTYKIEESGGIIPR